MIIFRHFLVYLGDELNRACMGNGTDAESESVLSYIFGKILSLRVTHSIFYILYFILIFYFIWVCVSITPPTPPGLLLPR